MKIATLDLTGIVIAAALAIGIFVIALIIRAVIDAGSKTAPDRPDWLGGIFIGCCLCACLAVVEWRENKTEKIIQSRAAAAMARQFVTINIDRDCPKPAPGLSDLVVMTISTAADNDPILHGCNRIAQRGPSAHR